MGPDPPATRRTTRGLVICRRRSARETRLARASYPGHATGFDEPWRLLAEDLSDVTVSTLGFGTGYLAHTHTRPPPRGRHRAPRGPG